MDLLGFTTAVYCRIDELFDALQADPDGRRSAFAHSAQVLADAEVLPMEAVDEYLGYDQDVAIY